MNVWGSWCPPCRAEAPHFAKVAKETKAKGVEFVGINTRDANKGPALAFEKDYEIGYPSLYDPVSKLIVNGFPKGSLNPQAIPSTIVLDREERSRHARSWLSTARGSTRSSIRWSRRSDRGTVLAR